MNFKRQFYRYHRAIGLLIMLPVFAWVISGLMHPFMANWFRPSIAKTYLIPKPIDQSKANVSLAIAAQRNGITKFRNANFIEVNNELYYQLHLSNDSLVYVNSSSGELAVQLDTSYAVDLARQFLADSISSVQGIEKVEEFTTEYREINRLLPVWKVSFDRSDGMEVYIHTASSRLGTFNNNYRKWHVRIFNWLHNWGFIGGPNWLRVAIVGGFSAFVFIVALLGVVIYGFNWKKFKRISTSKNENLRKRKLHRRVGLWFSLFMFLFAFSGSYHVWVKLQPDDRLAYFDKTQLDASTVNNLDLVLRSYRLVNFSLHKINGVTHARIVHAEKGKPTVNYVDLTTIIELEDGEVAYAKQLAKQFSGLEKVKTVAPIYKFKGEYGFVNKCLPVQKVSFDTEDNTTLYIETRTGKLAAKVNDASRAEGYSFALLHKFHFLDGLGKNFRDIFAVLGAFVVLVVVFFGWRIK